MQKFSNFEIGLLEKLITNSHPNFVPHFLPHWLQFLTTRHVKETCSRVFINLFDTQVISGIVDGHPEFHFMKMCEENLTALCIKPDPICNIFRFKVANPPQIG